MYNGLCCYCESAVGIVDHPNIEHRKPKRPFPNYTYRWNNLHLACQKCNTPKGIKFDTNQPILDAVEDVPIADYIGYDINQTGVWRKPITRRGKTTIDHTQLNRDPLRTARVKIFLQVMGIIDVANEDPNSPAIIMVISQLKEMTKGEYGSLVELAMSRFHLPT